ncbi:uncharacterized protein [Drosophila virilis]|uniref:SCP domain-containing protein n=1 Tax=Drosophila virilis TaxID=7244 RepID=B4LCF8_DROVI|nr:uncharacterized protein LOC6624134 [Drosophila virilis]EDW69821.2 uncharacterized protein Dvir_GJ11914 [Drosophila virilis]
MMTSLSLYSLIVMLGIVFGQEDKITGKTFYPTGFLAAGIGFLPDLQQSAPKEQVFLPNGQQFPPYTPKFPPNGRELIPYGSQIPSSGREFPSNGQQTPNNGEQSPSNAQQITTKQTCLPREWAANCPTSPLPFKANMTPVLINYILTLHNYLRSSSLLGRGAPPKVLPLRWNADLATLAEGNIMQCKVVHDECASVKYKRSAQNIALSSYTGNLNARSDNELVKSCLHSWWNEYKASNYQNVGHGKHIAVGCAASRFFQNNEHKFLFACNYATTDSDGNLEIADGQRNANAMSIFS